MAKPKVKSYFAIHEAVVLTGFSKYMLDYLAREKIFIPVEPEKRGRGVRRRYSYADVVLLRALHAICAGKGKIVHLRDALISLRDTFGPISPGRRLSGHLLVQGDELCVRTGHQAVQELRTGQLTLSFAVDLGGISDHIADSVVVERADFALTGRMAKLADLERQRTWGPIRARRKAARLARLAGGQK